MGSKKKGIGNPVDAVQIIFSALEPLDVDTRQRVVSSVLSLFGTAAPAVPTPTQTNQQSHRGSESGSRISDRVKSPVELIHEKSPATNAQRIALFAYHREKFEGESRFSRADLRGYFSKAKEPPPANYDRDFSVAVREGWIHEDGSESYLTSRGLEAVEAGFGGKPRPRGRSAPAKSSRRKTSAAKGSKR